jgi:hypothetical protein
VKKRRRHSAWGVATRAPPPLVWCTATPVAVTDWEAKSSELPWEAPPLCLVATPPLGRCPPRHGQEAAKVKVSPE